MKISYGSMCVKGVKYGISYLVSLDRIDYMYGFDWWIRSEFLIWNVLP